MRNFALGESLTLGTASQLNITGDITVCCWAIVDGDNEVIFAAFDAQAPNEGWGFGIGASVVAAGCLSYWSDTIATWQGGNTDVRSVLHHIGFVISGTGAAAGTFYLDGNADGTWSHTAPTSYAGNKAVGANEDLGASFLDAQVSDLSVWNVALTASEMLSLSKRFSPLIVHPRNLVFYMPMLRRASPEIEIMNGINGTIGGSLDQIDHTSRVMYPD